MSDALTRIFKDNLYKKAKERNWQRQADRAGDELVEQIEDMFPHQDVALCAMVHAMASLIMYTDKPKRPLLTDLIKDAVKEQLALLEEDADEEGPGEEDDEQLENEDDVDFSGVPERPSPEPTEDGDDDGLEDEDPNESTFNNNKPQNLAGYQPKRRRPRAE